MNPQCPDCHHHMSWHEPKCVVNVAETGVKLCDCNPVHATPAAELTEATLNEAMAEIDKLVDVPGTGVTSAPPIPTKHQLIRREILDLLERIVPKGGLKYTDMTMLRHEIDQTTEAIYDRSIDPQPEPTAESADIDRIFTDEGQALIDEGYDLEPIKRRIQALLVTAKAEGWREGAEQFADWLEADYGLDVSDQFMKWRDTPDEA
jgi:hypothetical protein